MVELIKFGGIIIPKKYENDPFYTQVKEFLHRRYKQYQTADFASYNFYLESDGNLKIPRFFPISIYTDCNIIDKDSVGEDINITHNIVPRDDVQKSIINHLMNNNRGIIQAPPASGKTVVCIYAVAEKKKKTLILVHKDSLADQWKGPGIEKKSGFLDFTNLNPDDIARLTSSTFEDDLKKPIIISTTQMFLSLLKRHRLEFLTALKDANIGIFIADEVHTSVGAPQFSECSIHIPSKQVIGLSATPYRMDGNEDVIRYHLGEVFVPEGERKILPAKITILLMNFGIPSKSKGFIYWGGEFQRSRYLSQMKKAEKMINVCKSLLERFTAEDRDIIFMAERTKFIDEMYDWLPYSSKSKFYKSAKLDELEQKVTFSTPGKIRDGVDAPKKDCLILTSPIGNIEQMVGRIERQVEGKKQLIIVDMVDISYPRISITVSPRIRYYEKKGWGLQYIFINEDGSLKKVNKEDALKLAGVIKE